MSNLLVRNFLELETIAYERTYAAMKDITRLRGADTSDEVWFVEHNPVFTLGQAADRSHVISAGDIPVVETDRGGEVTYHGPGLIMIYCLFDVSRLKLNVREVVEKLETSVIDVLASLSINAVGDRSAPGVYVDGAKIASIGLRFSRGKCYHGLCLNFDAVLEPFQRINPCGYENLKVTQVSDLCEDPPSKTVLVQMLGETIRSNFGFESISPAKDATTVLDAAQSG